MLTPLQNASMQFGHVEFPKLFAPDCESGDWQWTNVSVFFSETPCVFLTASDLGAEQSSGNFTAVVGVAQDVQPNVFQLGGRNSDCSPGVAHMNWLALLETNQPQSSIKQVRMGTLFPKRFHRDCEPGDWNTWDVRFSEPASPEPPLIFASAADRFAEAAAVFEHGDFSAWVPTNYATPAVPVARKRTTSGFTLMGRNPDIDEGWSNFNYVALREFERVAGVPRPGSEQQLFVDFRSGGAALVRAVQRQAQGAGSLGHNLRSGLPHAAHGSGHRRASRQVRPCGGRHGLLRRAQWVPAPRAQHRLRGRRGGVQLGAFGCTLGCA